MISSLFQMLRSQLLGVLVLLPLVANAATPVIESATFKKPNTDGLDYEAVVTNDGSMGPVSLNVLVVSKDGVLLSEMVQGLTNPIPIGEHQKKSGRVVIYMSSLKLGDHIVMQLVNSDHILLTKLSVPMPAVSQQDMEELVRVEAIGDKRLGLEHSRPLNHNAYVQSFNLDIDSKDYQAADQLFIAINRDDARSPDGSWLLLTFLDAIDQPLLGQSPRAARSRIDAWLAADQDSPAAQFATLEAEIVQIQRLVEDQSKSADKTVGKVIRQRIDGVNKALDKMSTAGKATAFWWTRKLLIEELAGAREEKLLASYHQATHQHMAFGGLPIGFADLLADRPHIDWATIEAIATEAASSGNTTGKEIYALLYISVDNNYAGDDLFRDTKMRWPLMREGLVDLNNEYPSLLSVNYLAAYACRANDKDTYIAARDRLGPNGVNPFVWASNYSFDLCERHFSQPA